MNGRKSRLRRRAKTAVVLTEKGKELLAGVDAAEREEIARLQGNLVIAHDGLDREAAKLQMKVRDDARQSREWIRKEHAA